MRDKDTLVSAARLLGIDVKELAKSLVSKTVRIQNTDTIIQFGKHVAVSNRDSFAKAIYYKVFQWVIDTINTQIETSDKQKLSVGLLDIFGFEMFEHNTFGQYCINWCNEKLQALFVQQIFYNEQSEYQQENIQVTAKKLNIIFF